MNHTLFNIMFTIVPILIVCGFIYIFAMMFSPKLRGKMMSKQIKSLKYMYEDSKDDLTNMTTTANNAFIKAQKNILDQNEATLRDIATRKANINKESIETTVRSIRKGFEKNLIYCKYCGESIDSDSRFCKSCGKEQ